MTIDIYLKNSQLNDHDHSNDRLWYLRRKNLNQRFLFHILKISQISI